MSEGKEHEDPVNQKEKLLLRLQQVRELPLVHRCRLIYPTLIQPKAFTSKHAELRAAIASTLACQPTGVWLRSTVYQIHNCYVDPERECQRGTHPTVPFPFLASSFTNRRHLARSEANRRHRPLLSQPLYPTCHIWCVDPPTPWLLNCLTLPPPVINSFEDASETKACID